MQAARANDVRWQDGKAFSLVYSAEAEVNHLLQEVYALFFSENGLNPAAFPSLRKFETETVAMCAGLLGGDRNTTGSLTSGGTESILMALKSARDWSRIHRPQIREAEIIVPASAHPAFDKAAQYLGLQIRRTPVRDDFRADVAAMRRALTENTILLAASAPSYPHGVIDPVSEIARLAAENDLACHVDACVGGFMLPFIRRLGYPAPDFDLSVPGVTSISADLHKYGYAAKGASVILHRDPERRKVQFFVSVDWPGGIYASPTLSGTRPGGAIAAAWAALNYLGMEGYLRLAGTVMDAALRIRTRLAEIPGLYVLGDPEMSVMAIAASGVNIYDVGDELALRGWHLDKQQHPPSLHLTVSYAHAGVVDDFLADLAAAVESARRPALRRLGDAALLNLANAAVRALPERMVSRLMWRVGERLKTPGGLSRSAPMYGLIGSLPNRGDLHQLVTDLIDRMTRL